MEWYDRKPNWVSSIIFFSKTVEKVVFKEVSRIIIIIMIHLFEFTRCLGLSDIVDNGHDRKLLYWSKYNSLNIVLFIKVRKSINLNVRCF